MISQTRQSQLRRITCSKNGIQPDSSLVSALKQMGPPASRQEAQTFLGMANYMGPFIPNLNTLTAPLRELLTDKSLSYWKATYQEALDKIKESISNEVTFTYFDPKKPNRRIGPWPWRSFVTR